MKLESFAGDLHIHSALSPCAEREMDPPRVFRRALQLGLRVIAITDHHAVDNLPSFLMDVPPQLWVIPGIEVQTREEIHLLVLFGSLDAAMTFGQALANHLPDRQNVSAIFGEQAILDRQGNKQGENPQLLLTSMDLGLDGLLNWVRSYDALCYPAHVDRKTYGIQNQLGFIPPGLPLPTLEISYRMNGDLGGQKFPGYQVVQSSDAHQISEIGRGCSLFQMAEETWEELKAAFCQMEGRSIQV